MEMDLPGSAGSDGDCALYRHRRRSRAVTVELAVAAALRVAPAQLLASVRNSGAVPHPRRRVGRGRLAWLYSQTTYGGALGEYDIRGARAIPPAHARTLGLRSPGEREQGRMNATALDFAPQASLRPNEKPEHEKVRRE